MKKKVLATLIVLAAALLGGCSWELCSVSLEFGSGTCQRLHDACSHHGHGHRH